MDYNKHYTILIERARLRSLPIVAEKHHIVPKCLGGKNDSTNIVSLTPEEHYVAHQLLVKIHPTEHKLVYAAQMMCSSSKLTRRSNKLYGWLKRRYMTICKGRVGELNSSFGTKWVTDGINPIKIKNTDVLPPGYSEGRVLKLYTLCKICNKSTNSTLAGYCVQHRTESRQRINTDPYEVLNMYENGVPLNIILDKFGWKCEQNVTTYLRKKFPNRKKFAPKGREQKISP